MHLDKSRHFLIPFIWNDGLVVKVYEYNKGLFEEPYNKFPFFMESLWSIYIFRCLFVLSPQIIFFLLVIHFVNPSYFFTSLCFSLNVIKEICKIKNDIYLNLHIKELLNNISFIALTWKHILKNNKYVSVSLYTRESLYIVKEQADLRSNFRIYIE